MEGIWDSRNFSGFLCVAGARNLHPVPVAVDLSDILSSLISLLFSVALGGAEGVCCGHPLFKCWGTRLKIISWAPYDL